MLTETRLRSEQACEQSANDNTDKIVMAHVKHMARCRKMTQSFLVIPKVYLPRPL